MASSEKALTGAPLYRVWYVHGRLSRQEKLTAPMIAEELGYSLSTVKRDLKKMAETLGMPIGWDEPRQTYRYTEPCTTLPALRLDTRKSLLLALAGCTLGGTYRAPFARGFKEVLEEIRPLLGSAVTVAIEAVDQAISAPLDPVRETEFVHFPSILEAICQLQELSIRYQKPGDTPRTRLVQPLHLREMGGRWSLLAREPGGKTIKTFLLLRIRGAEVTGRNFVRPPDFDPAKHFRGSLRRFGGEKLHRVRLAIDAIAAHNARECSWHDSQRLDDRKDGRVEMALEVNSLVEAHNIALSWGEHVEVLSPPALRTMVRDSLRNALARYA